MNFEMKNKKWISPTICVTHTCNLNCIYCYENKKDNYSKLSFDKAIKIIDGIFEEKQDEVDGIEFCFIGGEPLLEFDLIKNIVEYYKLLEKQPNCNYIFSATTNGTILNSDMKKWLIKNKNKFILCLSLDGNKETQDYNRDKSFDKIDLNFFFNNYPNQGIKMTISQYSIYKLSENVKFIHSLGFKRINGVNLAEGDFDFSNEEYIKILVPQLKDLVDFYSSPKNSMLFNQLFDKKLEFLEDNARRYKKNCGIGGIGTAFYDVDGTKYPCVMCTPMTLEINQLRKLNSIDFFNDDQFVDYTCNEDCYIYPICSNCAGSNFRIRSSFSNRDKSRCQIKKLEVLFVAELIGRKIIQNPKLFNDDTVLYYTIEAIKKIKEIYYPIFKKYIE